MTQNITFLLTLLWLTAYTRCVAGSRSWAVFDAPLILVLRTRLFISVITLKHNVVCLLCKLAGVNSCYLPPDLFKNLFFFLVLNRFRSYHFADLLIISDLVPPGLVGGPAHCAPSQVSILRCRLFVTICCFSVFSSDDCT